MLDLRGRHCLVVGGGQVAARKVQSLLECGAKVLVVSPQLADEVALLVEEGAVTYRAGEYTSADLDGKSLIIAATDDALVNAQVYRDADARSLPVNVVDAPDLCSFIVPAIHRDGDLCVAVSTGGRSPGAAAQIRDEIAAHLGPGYGTYLTLLGEARHKLRQNCPDAAARKAKLAKLTDGRLLDLVKQGDTDGARELIQIWLSSE